MFSAGDTLEEAYINAKEAIAFHIEGMLEDGEEFPLPTDIKAHMNNKEFEGFTFTFVDVDLSHLMGKAEKLILLYQRCYYIKLMRLLQHIQSIKAVVVFWHNLQQINYLA